MSKLLTLLALLALPTDHAGGAALPIENFSLEAPGAVKQTDWEDVPGWNSDSVAQDSGVETGWGATDGTWTGFLWASD